MLFLSLLFSPGKTGYFETNKKGCIKLLIQPYEIYKKGQGSLCFYLPIG
jgi:hypothetical protein